MPKRSRSQLSRNSSQARASKIRRNEESSSETENRLSIHRQYVAQSRARESSTERSQRLAEQNMRTAQIRARESSLQRSQRLAEQNVRTLEYARESSLERSQRLTEQNLRTSHVHARESSTQRLQRLEEQNIRNIQSRTRESSSERFQRLQDQRERQQTSRARSRNQVLAHSNRSAFRYDPQIDYAQQSSVQIGDMNKICPKCSAKKWVDETNGMCCASGKVSLPSIQEPPQPIKNLLTNNHSLSRHFITNIRKYNSLFQMTSFGAKEIREGNFMPTFKIEGQVYHLIGSLLPPPGQNPQYLQVYFISDADQLSLRSNIAPTLKIDLINELQTALNSHNVYIRSFKQNIERNSSDNLKLIIHSDRPPQTAHPGRYNAPAVNEVAVLLVDEEKGPRDIVLHGRDGQLKRVSELHRSYDPLQYPLMFVKGEDGYYLTIPQEGTARNKTVTCMQFYAFRLMVRANCFNALHYYRDLFSQYIVDMMAKMISKRLNYICRNQQRLRAEEYIHLRDALNQDGNVDPSNIGQRVILPSSFTGSPRYLHENPRRDDLCPKLRETRLICHIYVQPEWPEIKAELLPDQRSFDRHDIISRVFHLKMKKFLNLFVKDEIFGKVKCYMASVEWQKRGLPHCHLLFWLETKIQPDEIDSVIVAELPNQQNDPILYDIVTKNMVHGPCGEHNLSAPFQAIKYICKYINKGSDQATFGVRNPNDEVENYVNGRYISTSEAAWRIFEFPIHERHPTVLQLAVHLENGQRVYFTTETAVQVAQNPLPQYYTWANNKFTRRKRGENVVGYPGIKKDSALGRVYGVHPSQSECFYLRMLLHHVRGPTSFQYLKTVDGVLKETYQAACRARGLLENDDHWENTLREASLSQCPLQLKCLWILSRNIFKDDLCEDIRHRIRQQNQDITLPYNEDIYNEGLIQIENKLLQLNDKSLSDFGLPSSVRTESNAAETMTHRYDTNNLTAFVNENLPKLVPDQRHAFETIVDSVIHDKRKVFFLDAPGGTGKTFLANLILAKIRQSGKIAIAVASSGIAATLLKDGKTAHSTFKLPLSVNLEQQSTCSIRKMDLLVNYYKTPH
ncbi:hypothetical protein EVAR_92009_1 [Eumeta japonica]|uniref:ATP-dependent DNA helicase n=1 Tax=Eumeta variegata TaxID=151549 RepID=A0A4C1ZW81_EUMVA|nr:hypothetical protein EVAR_92009_1 [Eumeta japonica]